MRPQAHIRRETDLVDTGTNSWIPFLDTYRTLCLAPTTVRDGPGCAFFYACTAYHKRGTAVCSNSLVMALDRVDAAVLTTLAGEVLRPAVVLAIVDGVLAAMRPRTGASEVEAIRAEQLVLAREVARLSTAIATGGELAPCWTP